MATKSSVDLSLAIFVPRSFESAPPPFCLTEKRATFVSKVGTLFFSQKKGHVHVKVTAHFCLTEKIQISMKSQQTGGLNGAIIIWTQQTMCALFGKQ